MHMLDGKRKEKLLDEFARLPSEGIYAKLAHLEGVEARELCLSSNYYADLCGGPGGWSRWDWFRLAFALELAGAAVDDAWLDGFTGGEEPPEGGLERALGDGLNVVGLGNLGIAFDRNWRQLGFEPKLLGQIDDMSCLSDFLYERFDCATPIPAFEKFVPGEDAFISYVVAFIPDGMGEARSAFGVLFDGAFQEFDCRPATSRKADVAEWVDLVRKAAFPKLSEVEREFARIPLPKSGDSWAVEVLPANRACEFDRRMDTKGYAVRLADGRRGAEVVIVVDSEYREVRYIQGNSSDPTTRLLCELFAAVGGAWCACWELAEQLAPAISSYESGYPD
jgi:hypothetical protein